MWWFECAGFLKIDDTSNCNCDELGSVVGGRVVEYYAKGMAMCS